MKQLFSLLLICYATVLFAQNRQPLHGRVVNAGVPTGGIFVINKTTGNEVKSGNDGFFSIAAKEGDKLAVYSNATQVREFSVTSASFKQNPYVLEVEPKSTELEEVVINDVSEEKLGLVPPGQKQYTPAERRLKTARSGMGLDQLINVLSGRMKMLKKAVETERKEALMENLDGIFTDDELEGFGVPRDQARGFLYYAVEDPRVVDAIKSRNESLLKLTLMELSEKYSKLQNQHE